MSGGILKIPVLIHIGMRIPVAECIAIFLHQVHALLQRLRKFRVVLVVSGAAAP